MAGTPKFTFGAVLGGLIGFFGGEAGKNLIEGIGKYFSHTENVRHIRLDEQKQIIELVRYHNEIKNSADSNYAPQLALFFSKYGPLSEASGRDLACLLIRNSRGPRVELKALADSIACQLPEETFVTAGAVESGPAAAPHSPCVPGKKIDVLLYPQISGPEQLDPLRSVFRQAFCDVEGVKQPGVEVISTYRGPTEIRFFKSADAEVAQKITAELAPYIQGLRCRLVPGYETKVRRTQIELWVAHNAALAQDPKPAGASVPTVCTT